MHKGIVTIWERELNPVNRQIQHENMKKEKELAELRKCTFSPDLMRTNRMEFDEDFNTRMSHWQKEKERKLEEIGVF